MAGNGWKWMKILVNFWKWVEMLEIRGNAGNGWKWLERSEMDEFFFFSHFFSASEATTVVYEDSLSIVLPRQFRLLEFVKGNGFCDKCL